ncbi:spore protease YyaC [Halalkalibacter urbisdiaboli]|uniref:spore protease YyaC n=1 Tax=Halalkalibacter urbisdiaboli TaxID=1960589 RepID=UPI000B4314AC|nr:spore protease YyaC [Halalkalibacter urbisdiaboli]
MSTNHRLFGKKHDSIRVHMDEEGASQQLADKIQQMTEIYHRREFVIVCIGTDRSTGDSLGPLVGSKLESTNLRRFQVYGTLESPVHAVNLKERLNEIYLKHPRPFILAIDACLGQSSSVGHISLGHGPLKPGAAVNKQLPEVGDIHMTGIVNIGGMMEYFVLQNTRLHTVMKMADMIATAIQKADLTLPERKETPSLLEAFKPSIFLKAKKETQL